MQLSKSPCQDQCPQETQSATVPGDLGDAGSTIGEDRAKDGLQLIANRANTAIIMENRWAALANACERYVSYEGWKELL